MPQSVTEDVNAGGNSLNIVNTIAAGVDQPILNNVGRTVAQETVPIFKDFGSLDGITYPTANLGQFLQDYQGVLTTRLQGTGISGFPTFYLGKLIESIGGDPDTTPVDPDSSFPVVGSATNQQGHYKVNAKAGDFLKFSTPSATTLTSLNTLLSGISNYALL